MAFSTEWDIDKYKSEFESDGHWELRKRFMVTHKDRFPEDKLVCLARVFFNVEFLGCRYSEKIMKLVAELSKGVADEYREKQKSKLKKTFVMASDAAGDKVKRSLNTSESHEKRSRTNSPSTSSAERKQVCFVHGGFDQTNKLLEQGDFPGFIIFHSCNTKGEMERCPINILTMSSQKCQRWHPIKFSFTNQGNSGIKCDISLNNKLLASGVANSQKEAKLVAATIGLNLLHKTCYTIQAKCKYFSEDNTFLSKEDVDKTKLTVDNPLPMDNIGSRMMMKMGWTGGGLGKNRQGIQTPVQAAPKIIQRSGFGRSGLNQLRNAFKNTLKQYADSDSHSDLVFSADFDNMERKELHKLAQSIGLKTRSYGKGDVRHLVVFKNFTVQEILTNLLSCGGANDKYLLISPEPDSMVAMPLDKVVKEEPTNIVIKQEPADIVMKDETSDVRIKQESPNLVVKEEPLEVFVMQDSPGIDIKKEPSDVIEGLCHISIRESTANIKKEYPSNIEQRLMKIETHNTSGNNQIKLDQEIAASVAKKYLQMAPPSYNTDETVRYIDKLLEDRRKNLNECQKRYDAVLETFRKYKQVTKQDKRTYRYCRKEIEMLTGQELDDILMLYSCKVSERYKEKKAVLSKKHRYEVLGIEIVKQHPTLKNAIIQQVKKKLGKIDIDYDDNKNRKFRKEFQFIGEMYGTKCNSVFTKSETEV